MISIKHYLTKYYEGGQRYAEAWLQLKRQGNENIAEMVEGTGKATQKRGEAE